MKNLSRKVLVLVMLVLFIGVGGVVAFIAIQIQGSQAPVNSNASGFGVTATRTLFTITYDKFKSTKCDQILSVKDIQTITSTALGSADVYSKVNVADLGTDVMTPKFCNYDFGNGKSFLFTINNYNLTSVVANSAEEEYAKVNKEQLSDQLKTAVNGPMTYFFGDQSNGTSCRTTIFHADNDFDFASITYSGVYDCNETVMVDFNDQVSKLISAHVTSIMNEVYLYAAQNKILH